MGTDGSVQDPMATYSFVISISQPDVTPEVKGGGFLPTTAQYLDPYSKRPEAAALLAGLTWIQELLRQFPNHTGSNPLPLPIPVDNEGVRMSTASSILKRLHTTYSLTQPRL